MIDFHRPGHKFNVYRITGNWRNRKHSRIFHKSTLARKHSQLTNNQDLIVTHNFWALILTTHVQYGNRS